MKRNKTKKTKKRNNNKSETYLFLFFSFCVYNVCVTQRTTTPSEELLQLCVVTTACICVYGCMVIRNEFIACQNEARMYKIKHEEKKSDAK